jgi:predicted phosphate transport protein (TIGR00153 family)
VKHRIVSVAIHLSVPKLRLGTKTKVRKKTEQKPDISSKVGASESFLAREERRMRFSLIPREEKFFDMLDEASAILNRAADKFLAMVTQFDRLQERSNEIKEEEHACDKVVERIITALDRTFITPIDREDIHTLTTRLDDILDNMEETAHRFVTFRIDKPTPSAESMAQIIHECCKHVTQALSLCRNLKEADKIQEHIREVGRLENEADNIYRESDGSLFANPPDILILIKWRELYSWLEETVDACKHLAVTISEVVIKGA